jgi:branched-chain amino acid transport system substrate-binding protein
MKRLTRMFGAMMALLAPAMAQAQDAKIGIIAPFSGAFANWGREYQRGIDLFLDEQKATNASPKVSVITRDTGGVNPNRARQLAQELILRDKVSILGGEVFSPNLLAITDLLTESKTPFVIFNGATAFITDKSPYFVRPTFTMWSLIYPAAKWYAENGYKTAVVLAADYSAGEDGTEAFSKGFEAGGGRLTGVIKVPLNTTDFAPYLQRLREAKPNGAFMFLPSPMSIGLLKAFYGQGLDKAGIQLFATTETGEEDLPAIGEIAVGTMSSNVYGPFLDNPVNNAFRATYQKKYPKELPSFMTLVAYDSLKLAAAMLQETRGVKDGDKMIAGLAKYKLESPRGPVSFDPKTREMIQNLYVRRVEKNSSGILFNKTLATITAVEDPWHKLQAEKK